MPKPIIRGLSHIAIAVNSFTLLDKWLSLFPVEKIQKYTSFEQKVNVLAINVGDFDIEFLEPISEDSSISGFLKKNPTGGLHHVCFYVEDLQSSLIELKNKGVRSLALKKLQGVINASPVAFLNPKDLSGTLIEFEQMPQDRQS